MASLETLLLRLCLLWVSLFALNLLDSLFLIRPKPEINPPSLVNQGVMVYGCIQSIRTRKDSERGESSAFFVASSNDNRNLPDPIKLFSTSVY